MENKDNKYSLKKYKNLLFIIFGAILILIFTNIILKLNLIIAEKIFNKPDTILFILNAGFWYTISLLSVFFSTLIICFSLMSYFIVDIKLSRTEYKLIFVCIIICFFSLLLSNFSYCILTNDKIYIRDYKFLFVEKKFNYSDVEVVNLSTYLPTRSISKTPALEYIISIEGININLMGSGSGFFNKNDKIGSGYYNEDEYLKNLSEIHYKFYKNNIKINKKIIQTTDIIENQIKKIELKVYQIHNARQAL